MPEQETTPFVFPGLLRRIHAMLVHFERDVRSFADELSRVPLTRDLQGARQGAMVMAVGFSLSTVVESTKFVASFIQDYLEKVEAPSEIRRQGDEA